MIEDSDFVITDQDIETAISNSSNELKPYLNAGIRSKGRKLPKKRQASQQGRSQEIGTE